MSKRMPHTANAEDSAPPSLDRASTGALDLRHALAASQQHLGAALQQIDALLEQRSHAAGDRLLQQVAVSLAACIRTSDTTCRHGGDEFVILLPELDGQQSAVSTAEKIRAHLAKPYCVRTTMINVTTSIGSALYHVDGKECGDLIRVSDLQMYHGKSRAPASPRILESTLHT